MYYLKNPITVKLTQMDHEFGRALDNHFLHCFLKMVMQKSKLGGFLFMNQITSENGNDSSIPCSVCNAITLSLWTTENRAKTLAFHFWK